MPDDDILPLIDLAGLRSPLAEERAAVAHAIGRACRDHGFFLIHEHGVAPATIAAGFAAAARLFALPAADKQALAIARHGHNRGYVGLGIEALDERAPPDLKEAYNLIWDGAAGRPPNVWPPLPDWREPVQQLFDTLLALGRQVHRAFALDLGLDEDFFADKLDAPMATLRLLHYPARLPSDAPPGQAGAGAHSDYGNLTLLATDGVAGLQVRHRDGHWLDVAAPPGALICNIGDCLMRWSNEVYVSTPHRVLPPPRERYSIAFFLDPNPDALVAAIPSCVPAGSAPRHAAITAAAYLQSRFAATYGKA